MQRLTPLSLEGLRFCIRPEYVGLPAEDLERVIDSISGLPSATTEDILKTLSALGKAVGPTLQRAAPGVAQGAATGASVGGPWGALIGAGAGLASSLMGSKGKPARSASTVVSASPSATGTPEMPAGPALPTTFLPTAPVVSTPSSATGTPEMPATPSLPTTSSITPEVSAPPSATGTPEMPAAPASDWPRSGSYAASLIQNPTVHQALLTPEYWVRRLVARKF